MKDVGKCGLASATHPRLRGAWRFGNIVRMNETSEQIPEAALRPIARDTSDFADLRRSGAIYVDKTAYFHRLIAHPMIWRLQVRS